jgi:hypothetical protein
VKEKRDDELERTLDEVAALLRRRHGPLIRKDRKAFRSACARGINKRFPMRRGRPRKGHLDRAERLRSKGWKWNDIFLEVEPRYKDMEPYDRKLFRDGLQAGLRGRKGRKKLRAIKRRELNSQVDSSASQPASDESTSKVRTRNLQKNAEKHTTG